MSCSASSIIVPSAGWSNASIPIAGPIFSRACKAKLSARPPHRLCRPAAATSRDHSRSRAVQGRRQVTAEKNPKLDPEPGSNTENRQQWVSGDEPMTGAEGLPSHDPLRRGQGRAPSRPADQGPGIEDDRRLKAKLGL